MNRFNYLIENNSDFARLLLNIAAENFGLNENHIPVECKKLTCEKCLFNSDVDDLNCSDLMREYLTENMIKCGELISYNDTPAIFVEYLKNCPGFCRIKILDNNRVRLVSVPIHSIKQFSYKINIKKKEG